MKSIFLTPLLLVVLLFSCKSEKREVEIIPDYDSIYVSTSNVDSSVSFFKEKDNDEIQKWALDLNDQLKNAVRKDLSKESKFPIFVRYAIRCYYNVDGELEKVKFINPSDYHYYVFEEKYYESTNVPTMKELFINKMAEKKFAVAYKNGRKVRFRQDFPGAFLVYQNGKVAQYMPLEQQQSEHYYSIVDEMPKPIGGIEGISKKVIYPEEAKRKGIEGKVFVNAVVDENGDMVDFSVQPYGHPDELLMKAAVDAVRRTKFIPGKLKGKPVKVMTIIPIKFELDNK